tara:strand:- start:6603 stop:6962 length:360 start_codon:yes stop_codon:yes gene_type:complete
MITITNIAKNKLINLINREGKAAFLYLKGGGCNGFSYKFKILKDESKVSKLDVKFPLETQIDIDISLNSNINLYLCNKSLMYIIGTKIDYKDDIMGSRFDFQNKNMDSKCGCGTSFNLK